VQDEDGTARFSGKFVAGQGERFTIFLFSKKHREYNEI
jgi:hypothetical protein